MKGFWRNFFYGFGITAIIIVCVVLCVFGFARSKEQMEKAGFQKNKGCIITALVY